MDNFRANNIKSREIVPMPSNLACLKGIDMGMGMTIFRMIRPAVNFNKFDIAVRKTLSTPLERKNSTRILQLLKQLNCPLDKTERILAYNSLSGLRGNHDFLELVSSQEGNDLLVLIKSGNLFLSNKITTSQGSLQEKAEDLLILNKLAKKSRTILLSRIFQNYAGDPHIEEFCYDSLSWKINFLDPEMKRIYFGHQRCRRGRSYPFLAGMSHGLYLIENNGEYEREGVVPICRSRTAQNTMVSPSLRAVELATNRIYCEKNINRTQFLNKLYEPLDTVLPNLQAVPHKKYRPVYNFRPCDMHH